LRALQFGQLGNGSTADANSPQLVGGGLAGEKVAQLACGWRHTVAVTESGRFFAWGRGVNGQLGTGGSADV
jgi:alpha-tubulin suppressor-like RCC1 family protein